MHHTTTKLPNNKRDTQKHHLDSEIYNTGSGVHMIEIETYFTSEKKETLTNAL